MTLGNVYLVCFLVGLVLSVLSALAGTLHLPHVHLPHVGAAGHGAPLGRGHAHGGKLAAINIGTVTAFLTWFGGAGYLMTRFYGRWWWVGLLVSVGVGMAGAAVVLWFVAAVLVSDEENLNPADYQMVGVLGRITSPIRAGGIGELVFSQQGTRRAAGARSEDGTPIPKGAEVIVTRYEKGIAYVRLWDTAVARTEPTNQRVES
jgi:membrane protein implicated in regulation of membrane protease activity